MANLSTASGSAEQAPRGARSSYFEQRLFELSPFGVWLTAGLIYLALVGAFAVAALGNGRPWIVQSAAGVMLDDRARIALVLAFIITAVLALQRYSRIKDDQDAPAMARILGPDADWAPQGFSPRRLQAATAVGFVISLTASLLLLPRDHARSDPASSVWFAGASVLLGVLFFRGIELTRMGSRQAADAVRDLKVDLLRVDQLYPWGRAAVRTSLIWFTVSAASILLFASNGLTLYMAIVLVACAAIGVWVFVGTLSLVHRRIRLVKAAALEDIRTEIADLKARLHADAGAPAKLQALLAYEGRIAAAPEWPFDQTILVRLCASALILTVPWFGQAIAGLVVEHVGKVVQ